MAFAMSSADYVAFLGIVGKEIKAQKDYVTALDAKTGDGDHCVNLIMGFEKLSSISAELAAAPLPEMLKKIGMAMMSAIGGSSGVLYGSSYIAAAKALSGAETLDGQGVLTLLDTQLNAIMERGKAQPGWKTMIDSLYEAVVAYRAALESGADDKSALEALKRGAHEGMEHTKEMEAVKGRASYQTNKGVGDLDPGAVTMCIQITYLADYIIQNKL